VKKALRAGKVPAVADGARRRVVVRVLRTGPKGSDVRKKLLTVLGAAFALLLLLIAIRAARRIGLDHEVAVYADDAVVAIATGWDEQALLQRASPEFLAATHNADLRQLFVQFGQLGRMTRHDGSMDWINVQMGLLPLSGKAVTAVCVAEADFEHGPAKIRLSLIKHRSGWQIMGLRVIRRTQPGQATPG
jgi:hypothetical protein